MASYVYSVTWVRDAWRVRNELVKGEKVSFKQFLAMSSKTKRRWIVVAKKRYLEGERCKATPSDYLAQRASYE